MERGLSAAIGLNNRGVLVLRKETTPDTLKAARNYFRAALKVVMRTLRTATKQEEPEDQHATSSNEDHDTADRTTTTSNEDDTDPERVALAGELRDQQGTAAEAVGIISTSSTTPRRQHGDLSSHHSPTREDLLSEEGLEEASMVEQPQQNEGSLYICSRLIKLIRVEDFAARHKCNDSNQQEQTQDQQQAHGEATSRSSNAGVVIAFNLALTLDLLRDSSSAEEDAHHLKSTIDLYKIAHRLSTRNLQSHRGTGATSYAGLRSASSDTPTSLISTDPVATDGTAHEQHQAQQRHHDQRSFDHFLHTVILNNLTVACLEAGHDSLESARRYFNQLADYGMHQQNFATRSPTGEEMNGIASNITRLNSLLHGAPAPAA